MLITRKNFVIRYSDGCQIYCGDHITIHTHNKPLCSIPEMNIMSHVNYTSTKNILEVTPRSRKTTGTPISREGKVMRAGLILSFKTTKNPGKIHVAVRH